MRLNQYHDAKYLELLRIVLDEGIQKEDRTGVGTLSSFGHHLRFDLSDGSIPLLTTKQMHTKSIIHEMLWFLSGSTDVTKLQQNNVRIWNEWAREDGTIGLGYGYMWRGFPTFIPDDNSGDNNSFNIEGSHGTLIRIDQIQMLINEIKNNPDSRRLLVSAWHPGHLKDTTLAPCHWSFQCYVANDQLSLLLNIRSNDLFLGNPFNIAQYGILLHMIAQCCNLLPGDLIVSIGDAHIYLNHIEQCEEQLTRIPHPSPTLLLNPNISNIFEFQYDDFIINNYKCHPPIKATVAV